MGGSDDPDWSYMYGRVDRSVSWPEPKKRLSEEEREELRERKLIKEFRRWCYANDRYDIIDADAEDARAAFENWLTWHKPGVKL